MLYEIEIEQPSANAVALPKYSTLYNPYHTKNKKEIEKIQQEIQANKQRPPTSKK